MPLQSAQVFTAPLHHMGKTTLAFQMSCHYAKSHPDISVMVMDLTEDGDLTKRMFGGADASRGKMEALRGLFGLLSEPSWPWRDGLDIISHAIKVAEHNTMMPPNLFLISSIVWADNPMKDDVRKQISTEVRESLDNSATTWKLLCDTDGDRRPCPMTLLGYSLCTEAIVPLNLSKADLQRMKQMLRMMNELKESGEILAQVLFVVWNSSCLRTGMVLPFTPTKASLKILAACNSMLFQLSQEFPGLFVHGEEDEATFKASTTCIADSIPKPSEELGLPFVEMCGLLAITGTSSVADRVATSVKAFEEKMGAGGNTRIGAVQAPDDQLPAHAGC